MKITLINPNIISQKDDFFGTGIPYIPLTLMYLSSFLKSKKYEVNIIDSFGENPEKISEKNEFLIQGLKLNEIIGKIPNNVSAIGIYAGLVVQHSRTIEILKKVKESFNKPIFVIENSQSVVAYSLKKVHKEFLDNGADYIIYGEPEKTVEELLFKIKNKKDMFNVKGVIFKKKEKTIINDQRPYVNNLDELPFPNWEEIPIKNYWGLRYAHAPKTSKKYLPILTSRGCPYQCKFCVIPSTNKKMWRFRSGNNVVDEIEYNYKKFGVKEFHIEDLNPTLNKKRTIEMCKEILKRKLKISFKFAAGTKVESIQAEMFNWLRKAGCTYISMSPESGSKKVLNLMNKRFDHEYGVKIAKKMHKTGIKSQACFVLGFPGETKEDLEKTKKYIIKLTKAGVDEIALFIMTPIPGSKPYESFEINIKNLSQLTFSPKWRKEYNYLSKFRTKTYITFIITKLFYHPLKLLKQGFNVIRGKFETKMEMTLYRVLFNKFKKRVIK